MESEDRELKSVDKSLSPLSEDDPELKREFNEWAQWLLDVYLWKLEQKRKAGDSAPVDP